MANANGTLSLAITQVSQNVTNNTSSVKVEVKLQFKNGWWASNTGTASTVYVTCDGQNQSFAGPLNYNIGANGSLVVGSRTFTVTHASNGTKSVSCSASWAVPYVSGGAITGSGSKTLSTIPRKTDVSFPAATMGATNTISLGIKSSSFTHTLRYVFGSSSGTIASGVKSNYSWAPPIALASQIPSATMGVGTLYCDTYNGSTLIGTTSCGLSLYLPENIVPTFNALSATLVNNGVPASWNQYVQGYSHITLNIAGASGVYGSSIGYYSTAGHGYSSTSVSSTFGPFSQAGSYTFTSYIRDSRGRTSASRTASITVVPYARPTLSMDARRCNADGTDNANGKYIKVIPTYTFSSVNGKNSITANSFKIEGTNYTKPCASNATIVLGNNDISVDKSYKVIGSVTDGMYNTTTYTEVVQTSESIIDVKANGKGIAFGKAAEVEGLIDSAWEIKTPILTSTTVNSSTLNCSSVVKGHYVVANNNQGLRVQDTSGNHIEIIYMAPSNRTILPNNPVQINSNFYVHGSSWLCTQFSADGWLGFYSENNGGTRKGWIGHDHGTTLNIVNETGGGTRISNSLAIAGSLTIEGYQSIYIGGIPYIYGSNTSLYVGASGDVVTTTLLRGQTVRIYSHGGGVFLGSSGSTSITSDRNEKHDILELNDKYETFFKSLTPVTYKYNEGTSQRNHIGFIAQDIEDALTLSNLDTKDFAGIIIEKDVTIDYDGGENSTGGKHYDKLYSLRYEEFIALNTKMIQKNMECIEKQAKEILDLKQSITNLEQQLVKLTTQ